MNKFITIIATGLLFGATSLAGAAPILSISAQGDDPAAQAESEFLGRLQGTSYTETFEDETRFTPGTQSTAIATQVGWTFLNEAGSGGLCDTDPYRCFRGMAVLDESTTPFDGRYAVSGDNWLDSMDAKKMTIDTVPGFNAIGFYMTDPNDAGGSFSISGVDFDFEDIFQSDLDNGSIFYVTIVDSAGLGDISILSNNPDDGYGLDDITLGTVAVPEPGTLALFGLGLAGVVVLRKRKQV